MAEDEITENWEELEDSGELDKRLKKIEIGNSTQEYRNVPRLQEDTERTTYQPQVRILKRQPKDDPTEGAKARSVLMKPTKTLAEREAAYAEARLRILGGTSGTEAQPAPAEDRPARLTQQAEVIKTADNIVRLPKGPDGTRGFHQATSASGDS